MRTVFAIAGSPRSYDRRLWRGDGTPPRYYSGSHEVNHLRGGCRARDVAYDSRSSMGAQAGAPVTIRERGSTPCSIALVWGNRRRRTPQRGVVSGREADVAAE